MFWSSRYSKGGGMHIDIHASFPIQFNPILVDQLCLVRYRLPLASQKLVLFNYSSDPLPLHPHYRPMCDPAPSTAFLRTCLLAYAVVAMGGCFIIEQPRSSMFPWHPRARELFKNLPQVGCLEKTVSQKHCYQRFGVIKLKTCQCFDSNLRLSNDLFLQAL